jgi:alpha-N-arabinofuranosidase
MPNAIEVLLDEAVGTINPLVYSHFTEHLGGCVYDGLWVGEDAECAHVGGLCEEVMRLVKRLNPPMVRWPGGCFADDYHWRDGVGPRQNRPRTVNIHWGNVVENNHFGTHEFIAFCRAVGAEPYLCGNVGSGSPAEMRDWVEYCNYPAESTLSEMRRASGQEAPFRVKYWGVGNENWGCGGNFSPEDYAGEYRRFSSYLREFEGCPLFLIACGPDGNNLEWTRRFFSKLHRDFGKYNRIHGYTPHYYCGTSGAGSATDFTDADWYELLHKARRMEELVVQQRQVMDEFDPQRRIALMVDEWGAWHYPTPGRNPAFLWQQNTLRDALVAATTLDIFNRHADKVHMSSIAQLVNVLQAPLLTESGKAVCTPTYHVYDLYQGHQGARSVRVEFSAQNVMFNYNDELKRLPALSGSASLKGSTLTLTVVNSRLGEQEDVEIRLRSSGGVGAMIVRQTVLTHEDMAAHNTFAEPGNVRLSEPKVLPLTGRDFACTFAGQSVTRLEMSLA